MSARSVTWIRFTLALAAWVAFGVALPLPALATRTPDAFSENIVDGVGCLLSSFTPIFWCVFPAIPFYAIANLVVLVAPWAAFKNPLQLRWPRALGVIAVVAVIAALLVPLLFGPLFVSYYLWLASVLLASGVMLSAVGWLSPSVWPRVEPDQIRVALALLAWAAFAVALPLSALRYNALDSGYKRSAAGFECLLASGYLPYWYRLPISLPCAAANVVVIAAPFVARNRKLPLPGLICGVTLAGVAAALLVPTQFPQVLRGYYLWVASVLLASGVMLSVVARRSARGWRATLQSRPVVTPDTTHSSPPANPPLDPPPH